MNVPFACVGVALLLVYAPRLVVAYAQSKQPEGYDNIDPRDQGARLPRWGRRAAAAHLNGFESFAPFAAAVILAHLAGVDRDRASILALVHVIARAIYPVLYMTGVGSVRSVVWCVGFGATLALLGLAIFA